METEKKRIWDYHDYPTRFCCKTGRGRLNYEPHAADCPRKECR